NATVGRHPAGFDVSADFRGRRAGIPFDPAQRTEVAEQRSGDTVVFRQEVRDPDIDRADGIDVAADGAAVAGDSHVTGADTGDLEAAEGVTALEEALVDADGLTVIGGDITRAARQRPNHAVEEQTVIDARRGLRAHVFQRAAEAREILAEAERESLGRLLIIVERVVAERIADQRCLRGAGGIENLLRDVGDIVRRHLVDAVAVTKLDAAEFRSREAQTERHGRRIALIGGLIEIRQVFDEIDAGCKRLVEEIRLGVADLELLADRRQRGAQAQILRAAEQVAFRIAEFADERALRGVTGTERKFAGRLFGDGDVERCLVGRGAGRRLDVDILEETQRTDAGAGTVEQDAVEGIAFDKPHFTADDLVQRARVAGDVDTLDIDARSLVDLQDDVDGAMIAVAADARMDFGECITLRARGIGQGVDGFLDQFGVVGVAAVDRNARAQNLGVEFLDVGFDLDIAEFVDGAFVDGEGEIE